MKPDLERSSSRNEASACSTVLSVVILDNGALGGAGALARGPTPWSSGL
jgi:hypothetical protein